ncbi:MAG TPA: hypothetical protein VE780_17955 [Thermoleophilaceae bacterium]|nr:hypothetical protein [Thermoleophilaceae bacterium]
MLRSPRCGPSSARLTRGLELPAVRSKQRRFCSPAEAERLLAALPAEDRRLWATAFYAGLHPPGSWWRCAGGTSTWLPE